MAGKKRLKDENTKLFAFLGVFLTVIGFIVVYATRKDDKYAMYYGKQGLVLFIAWIVVCIVGILVGWIPLIGWFVVMLMQVAMILLWVAGMVYSLSGRMTPIPLIGEFAEKIKA